MAARDPEGELKKLRARFGGISKDFERAQQRKRRGSWPLIVALVAVASFTGFLALFFLSPWPAGATLAHLAAFGGCDAARAFGVDQAGVGEAGYWPRLDPDRDGIACEPAGPSLDYVIVPVT